MPQASFGVLSATDSPQTGAWALCYSPACFFHGHATHAASRPALHSWRTPAFPNKARPRHFRSARRVLDHVSFGREFLSSPLLANRTCQSSERLCCRALPTTGSLSGEKSARVPRSHEPPRRASRVINSSHIGEFVIRCDGNACDRSLTSG
jgi:hypothetical protein